MMQNTPIGLLAKAPVFGLQLHIGESGLGLGDRVRLSLDADGRVLVCAHVRKRLCGFFRRSVLAPVGHLGPVVDRLVAPQIAAGLDLRARVVGITPEHLSADGRAEVFVSVWGVPR